MPSKIDGRLVTQGELAAIYGITTKTLREWEARGLPVIERGAKGKTASYNTAAVIRWREAQLLMSASGGAAAADTADAKRRRIMANAAMDEMNLAVRRGELVSIEEVGVAVEAEYSLVRSNFMALPGDVAAELLDRSIPDIQDILATKVSEILHGLSADEHFAGRRPAAPGAAERAQANAQAQPDRMG